MLQAGLFLQALGAYAVVFENRFGWSKTALSWGFALTRFESAMLGPIQGWALDRYGPRRIMRIGLVFTAIGFVAFSQIETLWQYYGALLIAAVGGSLSGFLTVVSATVSWFERRRARALSIMSMGFAVGGLISPVVVFAIEGFGWRETAAASGIIILVVGWPLSRPIGLSRSEMGLPPDGFEPVPETAERPIAEGVSTRHFTLGEAMRTPAFWLISLGHGAALLVVGSAIAHLALFLTGDRGYSLQEAGIIVGIVPLVQLVGMALGGNLGDRMNKRFLAAGAMAGHMIGMLLLAHSRNFAMILGFVVLHGLAWGVRGPLMQALRADYFGATSFAKIMGVSSTIVMLGSVGGPIFVGWMADRNGGYQAGLTVVALAAGAGAAFFLAARPPQLPSTPLSRSGDPVPKTDGAFGTAR